MNSSLITSTYLVGDNMTLADATAIASLSQLILTLPKLLQGIEFHKSLPHLMRWFLTCLHDPKITIVLGNETLKSFQSLISAAPPLVQAGISSNLKTSSSCTPAEAKVKANQAASALSAGSKFQYKNEVEGTPSLNFKYTLK